MKRPRKSPDLPRRSAGFQDVVAGEGGEPVTGGGMGDDTSVAVESYSTDDYDPDSGTAGTTSGTGTLQLEVTLLAINAVDIIAAEIARKVAAKAAEAKLKGIVIASPEMIAILRLRAALIAEIDSLEEIVRRAEMTGQAEFALAPAAVLAAVEKVKGVVKGAATALRTFAVTTRYSGRKDVVRQVTLDAALAKHLGGIGLKVELPQYALPGPAGDGVTARALHLQMCCRQVMASGAESPELSAAADAIDGIVAAVFGAADERATSAKLAQQLMLADGIAGSVARGHAALFCQLTASGGSYRTRRWLFNFLTGGDGLTYNGGASVTYFLFRGGQQASLDSDTIYFATPHDRFDHPSVGRHRPTNIGRAG